MTEIEEGKKEKKTYRDRERIRQKYSRQANNWMLSKE